MMLNGGKWGNTRLLSRKTVELMTHDQLGKIGPEQAFGLGFGISGVKTPLEELGTPGSYNWGGFFYTGFSVDPKEDLIIVFMGQLHPDRGPDAGPPGARTGLCCHHRLNPAKARILGRNVCRGAQSHARIEAL